MHKQVQDFLAQMKARHPAAFQVDRVLECGSLDINGTPREFFTAGEYIGLDQQEGSGVDVVSLVHQYAPTELFDTIVSTEMLEHDPYWEESLARMVEMLRSGGTLILTLAGPNRPVHELDCSPVENYYRGLSASDVRDVLDRSAIFYQIVTEEHITGVHICAIGKQELPGTLTSIIVLTFNGLGHTIACLDSIKANTPEAHEIIVVDNASTDHTVEWLQENAAERGIRVIASKRNQGFAGGNNWGLALANGDVVVLLNNDTVVPAGWLGRLTAPLRRYQRCGLAGPMSNFVSGPQIVTDPGYNVLTREGLDEFAADWADVHRGQSIQTQRLVGFCLAIRRDVLNVIGGLDDRFFPGNFEDDDYCIRALIAGFEPRIARDCFVHHVGHVGFSSDGVDLARSMAENRGRFREKWGIPHDSTGEFQLVLPHFDPREHFQPLPQIVTRPDKMTLTFDQSEPLDTWPEITLLMIVRDEAENLQACIESCGDLCSEMVIVDTGSLDRTVQIAEELGARVIHHEWQADFSAARNAGLAEVATPWVFWMDADDRLGEEAVNELKLAAASDLADAFTCQVESKVVGQAVQFVTCTHLRLFRNVPGIAWEGACHEDISRSIRTAGMTSATTRIKILHIGYEGGLAIRQEKAKRNRDILLKQLAKRPDDMRLRYLLGVSLYVMEDITGALEHMRDVVKSNTPAINPDYELYQAHVLMISGNNTLGRWAEADEALARALRRYSESRHLWIIAAVHWIERDSWEKALEALDKAESLPLGGNRWPEGTISTYRQVIDQCIDEESQGALVQEVT